MTKRNIWIVETDIKKEECRTLRWNFEKARVRHKLWLNSDNMTKKRYTSSSNTLINSTLLKKWPHCIGLKHSRVATARNQENLGTLSYIKSSGISMRSLRVRVEESSRRNNWHNWRRKCKTMEELKKCMQKNENITR